MDKSASRGGASFEGMKEEGKSMWTQLKLHPEVNLSGPLDIRIPVESQQALIEGIADPLKKVFDVAYQALGARIREGKMPGKVDITLKITTEDMIADDVGVPQ